MPPPSVALLGGTGRLGPGLAMRFALAGVRVRIGSREHARGEEGAAAVAERLAAPGAAVGATAGALVSGHDNAEAAAGAAIVLVEILHAVTRRLGRRSVLAADLARTAHHPFLATVTLFAVQQVIRWQAGDFPGRD
ncbi:MAG TPA: hypothetical protein VFO60_04950, partial [Candidatus Dormibacteraeota bacterium]|nr:hypothetical protein [Candidatus Dormibacteraeota bacterium]